MIGCQEATMAERRIDNRRDILLLLLYSPGVHDAPNEPIVGRTRLVKMLFLFKEELLDEFRRGTEITEEKFYEFFPWSYGPFSSQVYDDLNFFILRGFIQTSETTEDTLPESLAEWDLWLSGSSGSTDSNLVDYGEAEFFLTPAKGLPFAKDLYARLNTQQRQTLLQFKKHMARTPLRSILKYVYEKYPDQIDKSEIREQVLGG
jgi:hypothetical protein